MKHTHLLECRSTQIFLKKDIERNGWKGVPLLVSTSRQTEGRGRGNNQWIHSENALAFSLAINPHPEPMLTPLEIGSLLIKYFSPNTLFLKWPNDLINSHEQKCGGILCSLLNNNTIVIGIGINLGKSDFKNIPTESLSPGSVDSKKILTEKEKEEIPCSISQYIIENRMIEEQVIQTWNEHCFHVGKRVLISDGKSSLSGSFQGITSKGEAIIENDGILKYAITGSLSIR